MDPAELFASHLSFIDRITAGVCSRARIFGPDAEDFASDVRLALIDNDFAVLREFEGRASLHAFLAVVIERLMFDQRSRTFGRWTPSAQARRLGDAAMLLEKLLLRDRRSIEEALPFLTAAHPELTRPQIDQLIDALPGRTPRPRPVLLDAVVEETVPSADNADERALAHEADGLAARTSVVVRGVMETFSAEDRLIIRFRFGSSMTIADISRMTRLPQRPLYRRIESLLAAIRCALDDAGIDSLSVTGLIGVSVDNMNFGLSDAENGAPLQSSVNEEAQ